MSKPPARFGLEVTLIFAVVQLLTYLVLGMDATAKQFIISTGPLVAGIISGIQYGLMKDISRRSGSGE